MMHHLYRIGIQLRTRPAEERPSWRLDIDELESSLDSVFPNPLVDSLSVEAAALSTDARSEIYLASTGPVASGELRELFARLAGCIPCSLSLKIERDDEAIRRLFRVAAGLDSPLRGEGKILNQLRRAFERASLASRDSLLKGLGQRAIATGRKVRRLPNLPVDEIEHLTHRNASAFNESWHRRRRLAGRRLVLASHGAGDGSDANRGAQALAHRVGERLGQLEVSNVFHLGEPGFASLGAGRLDGQPETMVLPLLTSRGYFYRRLEGAIAGAELLPPFGEDPRTHALIVRELEQGISHVAQHDLAVLIVGHGTRKDGRSGDTTRELAEVIQQALPSARVEPAFLDQDPEMAEVARQLVTERKHLAIVPFLLGRASHAREDLDNALQNLDPSRRIDVPALLDLPKLPHVLTSIATGRRRPLRLGARHSALRKARRVATDLGALGLPVELVSIDPAADGDCLLSPGRFADDPKSLLLSGAIDLALHRLEDQPLEEHADLEIAAVLNAVRTSESGHDPAIFMIQARRGSSAAFEVARLDHPTTRRDAAAWAARFDERKAA